MHLAQLNVGEILYPMDDPRMAGFADRLDAVNALADRSEGFIWRLVDDDPTYDAATELRLPGDQDMLVNMSVWTGFEPLYRYVYKTVHAKIMRDRRNWFKPLKRRHLVLWWIEPGALPTLEDAAERLGHLDQHGATPFAFDFATPFNADGSRLQKTLPKKDCA
jgi:hypothetical protein